MKLNKLAIGALSLGLGLASVQANFVPVPGNYTVIHLTGSTAFRGATIRAVINALGGYGACNIAAYKCSAAGAVPTGYTQDQTAKYNNIYGNLPGCGIVLVKCGWSGSEAGWVDVTTCSSQKENFMLDTEPLGDAGTPIINTGDATLGYVSEGAGVNGELDLAMADNSQAYSRAKGLAIGNAYAVGVIPFVYSKNAQNVADQVAPWSSVNNITHPQIRNLIKSGFIDAATLTGNSGDAGKFFYLAGRNYNSGTRNNHLLNAGLPTTQAEKQITISGADQAPVKSALSAVSLAGQDSGGTLATTMSYRGSGAAGWWAIAYLGVPDAVGAQLVNAGGGPVILSLTGVTETTAAVQQGEYTYWGTEWIAVSTCANACANTLYNTLTANNSSTLAFDNAITANLEIALGSMACTKTTDASDPVHN